MYRFVDMAAQNDTDIHAGPLHLCPIKQINTALVYNTVENDMTLNYAQLTY